MEKITNAMPETEVTAITEPVTCLCIDCGKEFTVSEEEQKWYYDLEYKLPKRCSDCRKVKRSDKLRKKKERRTSLKEKGQSREIIIKFPIEIAGLSAKETEAVFESIAKELSDNITKVIYPRKGV